MGVDGRPLASVDEEKRVGTIEQEERGVQEHSRKEGIDEKGETGDSRIERTSAGLGVEHMA